MQLDNLVNRIQSNCTSLKQVVDIKNISRDTIDSSEILYQLANAVFVNKTYPLTLPKKDLKFPAAVFSLQASKKIAISSVDLLQNDVFIVYFQTKEKTNVGGYSQLIDLRAQFRNELLQYGENNIATEIEISDETLSYIDELDCYQCAMQIEITFLMGVNQNAPAVFVAEEQSTAQDSDFDICVVQDKKTSISATIICKKDDIDSTRSCLQSAILGFEPETDYTPLMFSVEDRIDIVSELVIWQQVYKTSSRIR